MEAAPPPNSQSPRSRWWIFALLLAFALGLMWLWPSRGGEGARPPVDYSVFWSWVEKDAVKSVVIEDQSLRGDLSSPQTLDKQKIERFRTTIPSTDEGLLPLLRSHGVDIKVKEKSSSWGAQLLYSLLPWVLIIGIWVWLWRRAQRMVGGPGGAMSQVIRPRSHKFDKTGSVDVTFDDVAGLSSAKRDLQEIIHFLKSPARFRRLGGKVPRGVLLVGPPGTGKTLLARAVAGESGVPFFSMSASEFIEMFVGVGAARVRDLFEEAKKSAPSIIFIDELDAVGRARGAGLGGGHDEREQTLNQLLAEMDGFNRNDLTIVMAATNRPDVLDPALLRPGRFDRRVFVGRPERAARRAILEVHTRKMPLDADVDLDEIAGNTPGFSGADLANLVNEAALEATRRGGNTIADADFAAAYDKVVLGDARETALEPDEKRRVAIHESGHALVAALTPGAEPPRRISIIPRGMALGATHQIPQGDRHLLTRPELVARLRVAMGGYAAEKMLLGEISTGAENDLKNATELAVKMVAHYGMSEALGPVYLEHHSEHPFLGHRIATNGGTSDATIHAVENEVRHLLSAAAEEAAELLEANRAKLDELIALLLERETLERAELEPMLAA